ncbi:MAG: hypothetical protein HC797_01990 [Anaerolineales bacterium]|nr:hypothetical protein [Anaerolineales bacterium]
MQAFLGNFITAGICLLLGVGGFWLALYRTKKKRKKTQENIERVALGCVSIIILLTSVIIAGGAFNDFQTGDETRVVIVDDKQEVTSNCGTIKRRFITCKSYILETHMGQVYYDFSVPEEIWEQINVNACYQITYYETKALLEKYLQEDVPKTYYAISLVTKIEKVSCP